MNAVLAASSSTHAVAACTTKKRMLPPPNVAAATCAKPIEPLVELSELGMVAANVLARAIARGVYHAKRLPFAGALPSWQDRFGG